MGFEHVHAHDPGFLLFGIAVAERVNRIIRSNKVRRISDEILTFF